MKMTYRSLRYQLFSIIAIVFILGFPGQDILQAVARETLSGGMAAAEYNELAEKFNQAKRTYKDFRVESVDEFIKIYNYREKLISDGKIKHKFRTRSGQEIHCIDIYSQGSIKRAGLKHEDIRFAPEVLPNSDEDNYALSKAYPSLFGMDGSIDENGNVRKCPKGSFPMLIPSLEDFCRFRTLENRFRKYPIQLKGGRGGVEGNSFLDEGSGHLNVEPPGTTHEYAHAYRRVDNIGQQADFNVWNPEVERSNEFSLCQLWVARGSGSDLQTVETGWQKYYDLYGDWNTHLFIYFTTHNYDSGYPGGYNLDVSGFVQTNSSVIIGGTLGPVSTIGGSQYSCTLMFFRDPGGDHHWWLKYGDTWVGYYPNSLFDSEGIANKTERIDYGGEIVNQETGGLHTTTDMGSGRFANEGWQYSAFVKHIRYVDMNNYYQDATGLSRSVTDANYYDLILYSSSDSNWKNYFYYGGPGRVTAPVSSSTTTTGYSSSSSSTTTTGYSSSSTTTIGYSSSSTTTIGYSSTTTTAPVSSSTTTIAPVSSSTTYQSSSTTTVQPVSSTSTYRSSSTTYGSSSTTTYPSTSTYRSSSTTTYSSSSTTTYVPTSTTTINDYIWPTAYNILFDDFSDLDILRQYRDEFLVDTEKGRIYIEWLYRFSDDIFTVLMDNPDMMRWASTLIKDNIDAVDAILNGNEGVIYNTDEIIYFLNAFSEKSPPVLRFFADIASLEILNKRKHGELYFGFRLN